MGPCISFLRSRPKELEEEDTEKPLFSWDIRRQEQATDPRDYTVENVTDETVGRLPGTVNGQQFIIRDCKGANIYIFDSIATVTVDDCTDCRVFIGPSKGSVYIRDCSDCKLMVACQQFRTRDCKKLDILLSCVTQPIIESSTGLKFGCFQAYYPELQEQFCKADVSVYNNNWSNIHDFTPVPSENNFTLLPENAAIETIIPLPSTEELSGVGLSYDSNNSVVPLTLGNRRKPSHESCLVVFFQEVTYKDRITKFIQNLSSNSKCVLVQTKQVKMSPDEALRVFNTDSYTALVQEESVVGIELNGEDAVKISQNIALQVSPQTEGLVFVSNSPSEAVHQIENFYNYADMQMSV